MSPVSTVLSLLGKHHRPAVRSGDPEADIYILCLGTTGCGKSTFIEGLSDSENSGPTGGAEEGQPGLYSYTKVVRWTEVKEPSGVAEDRKVLIGDVPGFENSDKELTDPAIINMALTSLHDQVQKSRKQLLKVGVLLFQELYDDRPRLRDDVEAITSGGGGAIDRILGSLTIVTTKWPTSTEESGANSGATRECERRHDAFETLLSPLIQSNAVLKRHKQSRDGVDIVQDLVDRVYKNNYVIQFKDLSAPFTKPKHPRRSWLGRFLGYLNCLSP